MQWSAAMQLMDLMQDGKSWEYFYFSCTTFLQAVYMSNFPYTTYGQLHSGGLISSAFSVMIRMCTLVVSYIFLSPLLH